MKNFYSKFDDVALTFSDFKLDDNNCNYIDVLLQRNDDFILTSIPAFEVINSHGFTNDEINFWINYTMRNSTLIWDIAHDIAGDFVA